MFRVAEAEEEEEGTGDVSGGGLVEGGRRSRGKRREGIVCLAKVQD